MEKRKLSKSALKIVLIIICGVGVVLVLIVVLFSHADNTYKTEIRVYVEDEGADQ